MLKLLKLRKERKEKENDLNKIRDKQADYQKREEELETALGEAESDEDIKVIEDDIAQLEKEEGEEDLSAAAAKLESEIENINSQITDIEEKTKRAAGTDPTPGDGEEKKGEKREMAIMTKKRYKDMTFQEREVFTEREDVKAFLSDVKNTLGKKERAVSGVDVTIPPIVVDLLRPEIQTSSKLLSRVYSRSVKGTARQEVMGTIPEAVWTEMTGALNELDLQFYLAEVDGYKVGGFVPIANSYLEDSDVALMDEIMSTLGSCIGYGLDKAMVYGTGNKQPLGIITRLAQTSEPSDYSDKMPPWVDLHTSHILKASSNSLTGQQLFGEMAIAFANCNTKYAQGQDKIYLMNETTKGKLLAKLISFDASGTLVASINNQMPALGGEIITLDFMDDDDILGGYFKPYLLAERAGAKMAISDQVRFIEDQTVFKGTARYDGCPVIADSWVLFSITTSAAATASTFPEDSANTPIGLLIVTSAAGTATGDTKLTVSPALTYGNTYKYKIASDIAVPKYGEKLGSTWTIWDGSADITAATGSYLVLAECKSGKAVKAGITAVTAKAAA